MLFAMIDWAGGGVAVFVQNCLKIIELKSEFITFDDFEFIGFDLILNGLKLRILCIYISQNLCISIKIVSNMIDLIKHFTSKNVSLYTIGDFNFPNVDFSIPSSTFNEYNKNFIKVCSENFLTQVIDSPTQKDGGILDLVLCNCMGLDRIKFY